MAMTTIPEIKKHTQDQMDKTIAALKTTLSHIRTGRANPGILDSVQVEYYGSTVPISQVANVALLDARTLSVQPWEKGMGPKIEKAIRDSDLGLNPAAMGDLIRVPMPPMSEERRKEMTKLVRHEGEKAIRDSDLGLNPAAMGDLIRVPMPPMSEERRKEMTKLVRQEGENAKIAIRNVRRDANEHAKKLAKDKHISEDEVKRSEGDIQKVTDKHIADVDALIHAKEQEIMAV